MNGVVITSSFLFLVGMAHPNSDGLHPSSFLFLVVMPGATSSFLLLVALPLLLVETNGFVEKWSRKTQRCQRHQTTNGPRNGT